MSDDSLILYIRLGCHLCEEAAAMLGEMGLIFERVNIDRDPKLKTEYNWLVPVIYQPHTARELTYPFDEEKVCAFLSQ